MTFKHAKEVTAAFSSPTPEDVLATVRQTGCALYKRMADTFTRALVEETIRLNLLHTHEILKPDAEHTGARETSSVQSAHIYILVPGMCLKSECPFWKEER